MATAPLLSLPSCVRLLAFLISLLSLGDLASAGNSTSSGIQWVEYTGTNGQTVWLQNDRKPALYTQNFGNCQGNSLINITRFDAAYYADNMTVAFNFGGNSALTNESLMRTFGIPLFLLETC